MMLNNIINIASIFLVSAGASHAQLRGPGEIAPSEYNANEGGASKAASRRAQTGEGRALVGDTWESYHGAACRTTHGGRGEEDRDYYIAPHAANSFNKCQRKCRDRDECKGFEYSEGRCEIWTTYHGEVENDKHGFDCYWKITEDEGEHEFVAQPSIFQEVLPKGNPCNVDESSEFVRGQGGEQLNQVRIVLYDDELCLYSSVELVGTEMQYHIHGPAGRFENGDLLFDLTEDVELGAVDKEVCVDLDENLLDRHEYSEKEAIEAVKSAFRDGQTYINIHTEECPQGEQRGQIVPLFEQE